MTTIERLDHWKAGGVISEDQHALLSSYVRHERFSVFVELSALLYLGVLSIIGGLTWTFRDYNERLGDLVILAIFVILIAVSFGYCFSRTRPYSNDEVESPTFAFDYVLYFGCLVFASALAFIETRFAVFGGWDSHLLIAAIVFGVLAYRFDNRFVLSFALSTLAGFFGLKFDLFEEIRYDDLRVLAVLYGALLLLAGGLSWRYKVKGHFFDTYLQLGTNAILFATASGVDGPYGLIYLFTLLIVSGIAIFLGIRYRKFAFVLYGTLYGYAGLTIMVFDNIRGASAGMLWLVVTGSIVLVTLVFLARRVARDE